ncbi:hypothetical protein BT96DRAFT_881550 [Gymnopus androsaceus JB14]|uniref:CHAT domain-containing protein n=1 Tax=Gymnopus androsaceus JB14 TaxID=1447944 RepID=A0A6A4HT16_9AGAR|nr:hypothetical protein BT96DRAFT_881550 [Gymnopus androsaceus JB14]
MSHRRAVELVCDDHPRKPVFLRSLGAALRTRYQHAGNLADIENAIEAMSSAFELLPNAHPDKFLYLNDLEDAQIIHSNYRFNQTGDVSDLESAVETQSLAVKLASSDNLDMPFLLNNLGHIVSNRFDRFGDVEDMRAAFNCHQRAVELTPSGHSEEPYRLHCLAACFSQRYSRHGCLEDIEEAVKLQRLAIELLPREHSDKAEYLHTLGNVLCIRFRQFGDVEDIEDAIRARRLAVELTSDKHPDRARRLTTLGNTLLALSMQTKDLADIGEAIRYHYTAYKLMPYNSPTKSDIIINLATALICRFKQSHNAADIECAIRIQRHAVELTPEGHPDKPGFLYTLGEAFHACLSAQHFGYSARSNFLSAFESYLNAAAQNLGDPSFKLRAALQCTKMCFLNPHLLDSPNQVMRAHECVLSVIPQVVWLGHQVGRRYLELGKLGDAVNAAAAAALTAGEPLKALEWLEEGRSIVWGQVSRLRSPMDNLREQHPELADSLKQVSASLELSGNSTSTRGPPAHSYQLLRACSDREQEAIRRRSLTSEYENLLTQIRELPGFQSFLRPKKLSELVSACKSGPVIAINVHETRCDALILYGHSQVAHVCLPDLSYKHAHNWYTKMSLCLKDTGLLQRKMYLRRNVDIEGAGFLHKVLGQLWKCVVKPVLNVIKEQITIAHDKKTLPHVTWCATGPLAFMPLHAAGLYGPNTLPQDKAFNLVVSSYTPSVAALIRPELPEKTTLSMPKILAVSQPATPGQNALPGTTREVEMMRKHFGSAVNWLDREHATVGAVLEAMSSHNWVHLACHGTQGPAANLEESAFALYDGHMNLAQIMHKSLQHADLAVLSACHTATGDDDVPEESVHLAAGMLAVGYRSVVATMWCIRDNDAPVVVDALYGHLAKTLRDSVDGTDGREGVAYALHNAIRELRDRIGENEVARWIPYVHFGA